MLEMPAYKGANPLGARRHEFDGINTLLAGTDSAPNIERHWERNVRSGFCALTVRPIHHDNIDDLRCTIAVLTAITIIRADESTRAGAVRHKIRTRG